MGFEFKPDYDLKSIGNEDDSMEASPGQEWPPDIDTVSTARRPTYWARRFDYSKGKPARRMPKRKSQIPARPSNPRKKKNPK